MSRRNIARTVMVVWILALGWLARRQLFQDETGSLTSSAARLAPGARYFRVDAGTLQIGVLNLSWDTLPTGFEMVDLLALDLPDVAGIRRHLALTETVTSRALTLQGITRRMTGASGTQNLRVVLEPDTVQAYFTSTPEMGGHNVRSVGPRPTTLGILPLRLAYGNRLTTGEPILERVADLERRTTGTITGLVLADSTFILPDSVEYDTLANLWRTITMDTIRTRELAVEFGGLPERWWVDDDGRLVRLETLFGVTLQQSPFDYSQTLYRDSLRESGPVPRRALAGVRSLVGAGLRPDTSAATMRYLLSRVDRPLPPDAVSHLAGGAQLADSGILTVRRSWPTGTAAPPDGYLAPPQGRPEQAERLRLAADSAFTGATTARDSAIRLTRWVAQHLVVDTNTTRDAGQDRALRNGTGPPHVVAGLLVTLARTGGLAARVVSGLALVGEELLSHVWAEVWVGGRWVPVDPVFGHAPASARLLRMTEGGQGRPFDTLWRTAALRVVPLTPDSR